ncbi:SpoIIE family protein phosphatase [Kitasatospora atroaurantiaca]|uniref:PAS domain S-box-containing protein n=1 Tax=Kitasatospora atroaurantiaca TaxID=285545 RepID=A0A561F1D5_9ACTN|nr:SpoIIE family protein phosphatase [Kitasatospora atroaurantiaca]TWE21671.1 PAS domain S-box-containing protein [Kitasatospora atroaurantiaca]
MHTDRNDSSAEPGDRAIVEWAFAQSPVSMAIFDTQVRYWRLNETASRFMGVGEADLRGRGYLETAPEDEAGQGFHRRLRQVAESGQPACYESFTRAPSSTREHAWNTWMWPVRDEAGTVCAVAIAAFDNSEQHAARRRLALLNEASTTIGTTLDVLHTAAELARLVVPRLADFTTVDLLESVLYGQEPTPGPVGGSVVLRRVAHESVSPGVPETVVELGGIDSYPPFSPAARALAAGRPVLSGPGEPDFERWLAQDAARAAMVREYTLRSITAVPLSARGTTLGVAVFIRRDGRDPFDREDVALAGELGARAAVSIDNARRYTREHTTALALQRSLLPQGLPGQAAVEAASRYLPAHAGAGVGGDWFDVIPLSGIRVALVVGDVVGHGLHASATMGRLRTAVRTLADVDLPPDELLAHLDDMVSHLSVESENSGAAGDTHDAYAGPVPEAAGDIGATCLYAVYDPVSRRCTVASAGHPSPVLLRPDGVAEVIRLSPGPPLGVGGLPFEATELELPEDSLIALYTDGLVVSRDRDIDAGVEELGRVLTSASPSLEVTCDSVMKALLTARPTDDAALLLARTRALTADQVATWDIPADPALVADARNLAARQLAVWGLGEAAFVTELVVSELVTNAIRYGRTPIQLRLIRDRALICEVSDASNTAPHLRRARKFDEGGRGLLLVAQLTQRWGTRQSAVGKTIWAEQPLPTG